MKNFIKFAAVALIVAAFSTNVNAQIRASLGLEVALPFEDGYNFGIGASAGGEFLLGDNMGITAKIGYTALMVDADGGSASLIPMIAGFRYYLADNESGIYLTGQLGMTTFKYKQEYEFFGIKQTVEGSSTDLSYAFGAGMLLGDNIDLGLGYNIISGDGGSFNYLGLRAAYNF